MATSLPVEVIERVLEYLWQDTRALKQSSLACKTFLPTCRRQIHERYLFDPMYREQLIVPYFDFLSTNTHLLPFVTVLKIVGNAYGGLDTPHEELLSSVLQLITHLKEIIFFQIISSHSRPILNNLLLPQPSLRTLTLRGSTITSTQVLSFLALFPSIQELAIERCNIIGDPDFPFMGGEDVMPELTTLKLADSTGWDPTAVIGMFELPQLSQLKSLQLHAVGDRYTSMLLQRTFSSLKSLELGRIENQLPPSLALASNFALRHLYLHGTYEHGSTADLWIKPLLSTIRAPNSLEDIYIQLTLSRDWRGPRDWTDIDRLLTTSSAFPLLRTFLVKLVPPSKASNHRMGPMALQTLRRQLVGLLRQGIAHVTL